ncbi:ricin-type beta-trefoil lectin domain protein [Xanthomonas translucens]|uniref:ricin-type beta-trefoil lectin domain protein n=1 Tax=Xanthomonas campestris pv. translucens TaxID=343 RepID=UPI001E4D8E1A|nr:ricin-type beta-trefoil lectin domain protein [Xanthomonas translucens]
MTEQAHGKFNPTHQLTRQAIFNPDAVQGKPAYRLAANEGNRIETQVCAVSKEKRCMYNRGIILASCVAVAAGVWLGSCVSKSGASHAASNAGQAAAQGQAPVKTALARSAANGASPQLAPGASPYFDAPDNGTLVTYAGHATPTKEGPFELFPARISERYALRATMEGKMTIVAPDGTRLQMDYVRHTEGKNGNWTWVGRLPGALVGEESVITFGKNAVFGSLGASGGKVYRISTVEGQPYVMAASEVEVRSAAPSRRGDAREMLPSANAAPRAAATGIIPNYSNLGKVNAAAGTTSTNTIDVVLGYTPDYKAYRGGESATETVLTNLVEVANQAFANANVQARYRLVGIIEVGYTNNNDNSQALDELTWIQAYNDAFRPIRQVRENYGADLVALVRRLNSASQNSCGVAWVNGSTDSRYAYAIVSDGVDGNYSCYSTTLGHELGHLLGSHHQRETGQETGYNYGHRSDVGSFHTVMAYAVNGQREVNIYSTPAIQGCYGQACGVFAEADNASAFMLTVPRVVQYRATVVPFEDSSSPGQIVGPSGKCLDVVDGRTDNTARIQVWGCNGLRQQKWQWQSKSRALRNNGTDRVLDIAGAKSSNGAGVQLYQGLNASNQRWNFRSSSIIATGGKVLDVVNGGSGNGARLQTWDNLGGSNQTWQFDPATGAIQVSSGRCLDVMGGGVTNGTAVQLWDCSGNKYQKWSLGTNGSIVGYGGNCLEARGASGANGNTILMATCNGSAAQVWRIRGQIRSDLNNKCLDDSEGGRSNGARVQMWDCLGNPNQTWELQPN